MPDISIVIVSFNTRELLDKCIADVYADSPELDKEVIIIENASEDGSREMVADKWPQVHLIVNKDNRGYAPACNQGLAIAAGRYVFALNSDAFLKDNAMGKLVAYMDANPDVCACVPKLLNEDGSLQYACARKSPSVMDQWIHYSRVSRRSPKLAWRELSYMPIGDYASSRDVEVLSGAATLFRKTALETVGLLDDRLVINYDDIEWCLRAGKMGCRLAYYPEAEAMHVCCASRKFEPDSARMTNFATTFVFFGIAYARPAAIFLKLTVLCSLAGDALKAGTKAPFQAGQSKLFRSRAKTLAKVASLPLGRRTKR